MVIPGVAVAVRRLHDQGRSGGLVFIGVVPVIGTIILLVLMALPGESHDNRLWFTNRPCYPNKTNGP